MRWPCHDELQGYAIGLFAGKLTPAEVREVIEQSSGKPDVVSAAQPAAAAADEVASQRF